MGKYIFILLILFGCAGKKPVTTVSSGKGDTRTYEVVSIDQYTYLLDVYSKDETYGFTEKNPVKVGGIKDQSGPINERRYLNALLGPDGQKIDYFRVGSCCSFKTPNGFLDNKGFLDKYHVFWTGSRDTLEIFINMYDEGNLEIPVGFNARTLE